MKEEGVFKEAETENVRTVKTSKGHAVVPETTTPGAERQEPKGPCITLFALDGRLDTLPNNERNGGVRREEGLCRERNLGGPVK